MFNVLGDTLMDSLSTTTPQQLSRQHSIDFTVTCLQVWETPKMTLHRTHVGNIHCGTPHPTLYIPSPIRQWAQWNLPALWLPCLTRLHWAVPFCRLWAPLVIQEQCIPLLEPTPEQCSVCLCHHHHAVVTAQLQWAWSRLIYLVCSPISPLHVSPHCLVGPSWPCLPPTLPNPYCMPLVRLYWRRLVPNITCENPMLVIPMLWPCSSKCYRCRSHFVLNSSWNMHTNSHFYTPILMLPLPSTWTRYALPRAAPTAPFLTPNKCCRT